MISKFFIKHPAYKSNQASYLSADALAAASSFTLKNTQGFSTDKYVVLGRPGFENAEIVLPTTITAPTTVSIATAALKFAHDADSLATLFDYNQIKIYRSTTGIGGTYELLATIDIQVDHDTTYYEDTDSQTSYYYKFTYFNAKTSGETDKSDAIAATGFVFHSLKTIVDRVLSLFGDTKEEFVTYDEVRDFVQEFYDKAQNELAVVTKRFNIVPITYTLQDGVPTYDLPANFLMEKSLKLSTNGVDFDKPVIMKQLDSVGSVVQNNVYYTYLIYNSTIEFDPTPRNASEKIKMYYVSSPAVLALPTDTLANPFTTQSAMFVKYGLAMCYLKDKKTEDYKTLRDDANTSLENFLSFIKRLASKHPQASEMTDY